MGSSEEELQRLAIERIRAGQLPCLAQARMWGSHGTGAPCSLCLRPIGPEEVEYEVATAAGSAEHVLRFHLACHAIWQAECVRRGSAPAEAG